MGLKTAKVKMLKCQCTTYTKMQLEIKTVKAAIIKSNTKAWTKAAHLSCVLSGTPLKKCTVKAMPTVTAPKLAKGVGPNACHKPDGRTRYYYTFSDSASNTRYQHAGNYVGYQSNRNGQF